MPSRSSLARSATLLTAAGVSAAAHAQCDVSRVGMPDFDQRRHTLPSDGRMYCIPTATANALAYMSNHGLPDALDGPRDWQSATNYTYVSGRLVILGSLMDTSASDGTTMDDWFEATKGLVSDVGFSIVGYTTAKGLQGISPHQLADQMRLGAIVLPVVGWYDQISGNLWDRDGGHMLTMFAGLNTCDDPENMVLGYTDPDSGDPTTSQGAFRFTLTGFEHEPAWRFRNKSETLFWPRQVMQLDSLDSDNGFLDGFGAIWPVYGLTTDPFTGGVSVVVPDPPSDDPGPKAFQITQTTPDIGILAVGVGTLPTEGFMLTKPLTGTVATLHTVHYLNDELTAVADIAGARGMVVGRDGEAYVSTGGSLLRFELQEDGSHAQTGSVRLPAAADAMHYDDQADEVVILSMAARRIMRVTTDMEVRRNDAIQPGIPLLGEGSITTSPLDDTDYIACTGSPQLIHFRLDRTTGELELLGQPTLPGVAAPASLQMGDNGSLYVAEGGVIKAFKPFRLGEWEADASNPMDGVPSGPMFLIGRGRTNHDPEMNDINVLPSEVVEGEEFCRADLDLDGELTIFDFLEFQNLFDGGSTTADFDFDGVLTIFDFLAFQNAFDAGC
jgi:hypothetical protein